MTREEAKVFMLQFNTDKRLNPSEHEAVRVAIKVLEQEPCEDAVSRKAVINQIFYSTDNTGDVVLGSALRERIARLPSVTPQEPKTEMLDKIKTEIDSYCSDNRDRNDGLYIAMRIIDKYRESEEEE